MVKQIKTGLGKKKKIKAVGGVVGEEDVVMVMYAAVSALFSPSVSLLPSVSHCVDIP